MGTGINLLKSVVQTNVHGLDNSKICSSDIEYFKILFGIFLLYVRSADTFDKIQFCFRERYVCSKQLQRTCFLLINEQCT